MGKIKEVRHSGTDALLEGAEHWLSFYRQNPHRCARDYLGLNLRRFQEIILCMMFRYNNFIYLAGRGVGKTWLLAVFASIYSVLYPGAVIRVAAKTRGQAAELIDKIKKDLFDSSPYLRMEVEEVKDNPSECYILFKNGSLIDVVTSSQTSRGKRAHILIVDEYRMVSKVIIDTVLENFLKDPRQPGFINKPEYKNEPAERTKIIYSSSAWFEQHFSYRLVQDFKDKMSEGGDYFACAMPYQIAVKENLVDVARLQKQVESSDFDAVSWRMENECLFFGEGDGSLFSYGDIDKNRKLRFPWYPNRPEFKVLDARCKIPEKKLDEIRILSADIALMASTKFKNDASSLFVTQMTRQASGRYIKKVVYTENNEGLRTDVQALNIRRLYEDFNCDYICIDCKGAGLSVADLLMSDMTDPNTGEEYGALSCYNNEDIARRCMVSNAPKKIWAIQGSENFNSQCTLRLKDAFRTGEIRLLVSRLDVDEAVSEMKGFEKLNIEEATNLKLPYYNTELLISELVNLDYEVKGNSIKVKEKSGSRKDRYSSLSYNIYVAKEIERELNRKRSKNTSGSLLNLPFRQPLIKTRR